MSNRFSKPVAFNRTNPSDVEILEHVKKRNFSGYVKKLILEDMRRNGRIADVIEEAAPKKPLSAADRLAHLKRTSRVARSEN